jgi:hypothetical protein
MPWIMMKALTLWANMTLTIEMQPGIRWIATVHWKQKTLWLLITICGGFCKMWLCHRAIYCELVASWYSFLWKARSYMKKWLESSELVQRGLSICCNLFFAKSQALWQNNKIVIRRDVCFQCMQPWIQMANYLLASHACTCRWWRILNKVRNSLLLFIMIFDSAH